MDNADAIFSLSFVLVYILVFVGMFVSFLIPPMVAHFLEAFALHKMGRKMGRKYAWLAWIPIGGICFRIYVLSDLPGEKPVTLFPGKLVIDNRLKSYWIYLAISLLGSFVISVLLSFFSYIPMLNMILVPLPGAVCSYFHYVYLKDVLDQFLEDKESNNRISIIVTLLDSFAFGLARAICLLTIMKREPLTYPTETF